MKFGISMLATEHGAAPHEVAQRAEELGFESFFISEHSHIPITTRFPLADEVPLVYKSMFDPFISLASAAAVTEHIRLGTAICIVPQHDPINCAKAIATLDQISKGRFEFGIGAGWNEPEMANHGADFSKRFALTRETLAAMRALWQLDIAEYHGDYIHVEKSWMWPKPVQKPHPPILVAGSGPSILKRVVTQGDGWMPVFAMQWDDSLIGKQSRLESLPDDNKKLRELEDKYSQHKSSISAMGLPATPQYIEYLLENDVDRMILSIANDSVDGYSNALEQIANSVSAYQESA